MKHITQSQFIAEHLKCALEKGKLDDFGVDHSPFDRNENSFHFAIQWKDSNDFQFHRLPIQNWEV